VGIRAGRRPTYPAPNAAAWQAPHTCTACDISTHLAPAGNFCNVADNRYNAALAEAKENLFGAMDELLSKTGGLPPPSCLLQCTWQLLSLPWSAHQTCSNRRVLGASDSGSLIAGLDPCDIHILVTVCGAFCPIPRLVLPATLCR